LGKKISEHEQGWMLREISTNWVQLGEDEESCTNEEDFPLTSLSVRRQFVHHGSVGNMLLVEPRQSGFAPVWIAESIPVLAYR
jgi:hypothetical protein